MELFKVKEILSAVSGVKVAVVGDLILDSYVRGTVTRISPEAPVPVLHVRKTSYCLGGAANVMRNLTSLGGHALAFGAVGDDEAGRKLLGLLIDEKVQPAAVLPIPCRPTIEKQRLVAGSQQLARVDYEDISPFPAASRGKIRDALLYSIESDGLGALIFEDYAKGVLDSSLMSEALAACAAKGVYTSLDPNPKNNLSANGIRLMTPNHSEAYGLVGGQAPEDPPSVSEDVGLQETARRIKAIFGSPELLVTLGARGMALFEDGHPMLHIPTKAREVFDVTGAGDTVIAVYTLARAAGASAADAAELSNHAAGIVVGRFGTASVTPNELIHSFEAEQN